MHPNMRVVVAVIGVVASLLLAGAGAAALVGGVQFDGEVRSSQQLHASVSAAVARTIDADQSGEWAQYSADLTQYYTQVAHADGFTDVAVPAVSHDEWDALLTRMAVVAARTGVSPTWFAVNQLVTYQQLHQSSLDWRWPDSSEQSGSPYSDI